MKESKNSKEKIVNPAKKLLAALKFIFSIQKKTGSVITTNCFMFNHWAASTDGVLTFGTPIEEDLQACPHTFKLIEALKECTEKLTITQTSALEIVVDCDNFLGKVDCVDFSQIPISGPDPIQISASNTFKEGLFILQGILESSPDIRTGCIFITKNSAIATNGKTMLELWHGLNLPQNFAIIQHAAKHVGKCKKLLTGLGWSDSSITFHFEDGSFIKSQLVNLASYPDFTKILALPAKFNFLPVSENFIKYIKTISSFCDNSDIAYLESKTISSSEEDGSFFRIEGIPCKMMFSISELLSIAKVFNFAYFSNEKFEEPKVYFHNGSDMRGVLMAMVAVKEKELNFNDDIPF